MLSSVVRRFELPDNEFVDIPINDMTDFVGSSISIQYKEPRSSHLKMQGKRIHTQDGLSIFSCGGLYARLLKDTDEVSFFVMPKRSNRRTNATKG